MRRGSKFLVAGCVCWILLGIVHLVAHESAPAEFKTSDAYLAMKAYVLPVGGPESTLLKMFNGVNVMLAAVFCAVAVPGLVVLRDLSDSTARRLALAYGAVSVVATGISFVYFVLPPTIGFGASVVLFGIAWASYPKGGGAAS